MLLVDPSKRLDANGVLNHPWMQDNVTPRTELSEVTTKLRELNARRRLKRAQWMVYAANKLKNIIKHQD